jgi:hypothetical protein
MNDDIAARLHALGVTFYVGGLFYRNLSRGEAAANA